MSKLKMNKKRLLIVGLSLLSLVLAGQIAEYVARPRISYSLKQVDCSPTAIAERNKTIGADLKSCIIVITATNLKSEWDVVDYFGIGGGPIGKTPLIRINTINNKFCYGGPTDPSLTDFDPHQTNELTLRCLGVQKPPKNYDTNSDANPTSIEISGQGAKIVLPQN